MDEQRGFAPLYILISLAVIITAIGAYYIQKTTPAPVKTNKPAVVSQPTPTPKPQVDETANWKTYSNSKYSFEFKYPTNLTYKDQNWGTLLWNSNRISEVMNLRIETKPFPKPAKEQKVSISWISPNGSVTTNDVLFEVVEDKTNETNNSKIAIGRYWAACGTDCGYYIVTFQNGKNYYELILNAPGGALLFPLDQILSTFKFLDQNQAEGRFCGGVAANLPQNQCPSGYRCQLDGNYPDAGGKCVKK